MTQQLTEAIALTVLLILIFGGATLGIIGAHRDSKPVTFIGLGMLGVVILAALIGLGIAMTDLWVAALA